MAAALTKRYNSTLINKISVETYTSDLEYNDGVDTEEQKKKVIEKKQSMYKMIQETKGHKLLYEKDELDALNESMLSSDSRHNSFVKYKECTICLIDFKEGDKVKIVPGCEHLFH